jgi:hypothetical protein
MEKHGREQIAETSQIAQSSISLSHQLKEHMRSFQDIVASPKSLLIVRSAILTLLEAREEVSRDKVGQLLRDESYRAEALRKVKEQTPEYWSEQWNSSWRNDKEPLLSATQEQITRRAGLLEFWNKEWETISEDVKTHLTRAL